MEVGLRLCTPRLSHRRRSHEYVPPRSVAVTTRAKAPHLNKALEDIRAWLTQLDVAAHNQVPTDSVRTVTTTNIHQFGRMFSIRDRGTVELSVDESRAFDYLVSQLQCAAGNVSIPSRSSLGKRHAEHLLQLAILDILDHDDSVDLKVEAGNATRRLQDGIQVLPGLQTVFVPVCGISPKSLPFVLGTTLFLLPDEEDICALAAQLNSVLDSTLNPPEQKEAMKAQMRQALRKSLLNRPVARVDVRAHDRQASVELALDRVGLTLDVLNFLVDTQAPSESTFAYLPGHAVHRPEAIISLDSRCVPRFSNISYNAIGTTWAIEPKGLFRTKAAKDIYDAASILLADPEHDEITQRLIAALRWAGKARAERMLATKLCYSIRWHLKPYSWRTDRAAPWATDWSGGPRGS